jgi:hypothetical protein
VIPVDLGERNFDTREDSQFFEKVTAVREALRERDDGNGQAR